MWRSASMHCVLGAFLAFVPKSFGQNHEELKKENQELKACVQELEPPGNPQGSDHAPPHEDGHEHKTGEDHDHDGQWRFIDPVYPGWRKPTDEYRPYSWMAPPSEGFCKDLFAGRFVETHRSARGAPWIHPFTVEPPQMHRDLFFVYKYAKNAEGKSTDEHEAEYHVDWALTRRLGIAFAVPYLGLLDPDEQATGFGDLEVAPRVVFIESDTFYLSTNVLFTFPTGDRTRDLGAGETTIAPFLTTWNDLGSWGPWRNWNTLYVNFGPKFGLQSGQTSLHYTVVFAHSILGPRLVFPHPHGNGHHNGNGHDHDASVMSYFGPAYPPGLTSIILELNGQTELQGERVTLIQLLTGFAYAISESGEFRVGINLPLNRRQQQFDAQLIMAFSYLF